MASTYVNDLRLNELGTGDGSGTWGTTTNTNLELIGEAFSFGTEAITTNADTHASTVANGSTDQARSMYIKYTGALDSDCTITIGPNDMSRVHFIENATTDSGSSGPYNIIISQGSGANITIPNGDTKIVYLDGAGSGAAVVDALASLSVVNLKATGDITVGDDLIVSDDVTLKSDSSVLGFGADTDTTLTHTDGTGLTLNSTNKLTFGDVASFIQQSSDGVLRVDGEATIALNASTAVTVSHDLKLNTDGAILGFGADNDATLTHVNDGGLILGGTTPTLTIGDAGAEDSKLVFDGNAQDFHVGLDDSADDLVIGKGSALGTTPAISVDENLIVTVHNRSVSGTIVDEGNAGVFDLADGNDFKATPTSTVSALTFSNPTAGQSGNVFFDNSAGATVSAAHSAVAINAAALTSLSTAGVYFLTYYCTAGDSSANSILVSVSGALT